MINQIHNEDCLSTLKKMEDGNIDLVVTSPPYGKLRKYNGFSFDFENIAKELYLKIKDGGVIVWICQDQCENGGESGVSFRQALYFQQVGFTLYDTMIWLKPSPQAPTEGRYYDVFEYMFVLSKGKPKTLNLLKDRPNKSFGAKAKKETRSCKEDRVYKDETRVVREFSRRFNVWEISRGKNTTKHPAVFPEKLAEDHILSWSNEGDLVYDPFMGRGTTAKMSVKNNRNYIGSEISEEYCEIAKEYLKTSLQFDHV